MTGIQIKITDAGRAEIINAEHNGTAPVTITQVGVGTGQYSPSASQTALQSEIKRLSTIAGQVVANDTIHVTIKDESNDAYSVSEFGLYTASGTLFAVYSQTSGPVMQKAAPSSLLLSIDVILAALNATSLTFGDTSFSNPPASETVVGVVELATSAEVIAGADTTRVITPAGLAARTATEARAGIVELATAAETATGTDSARAVHPAGLKPLLDAKAPLASPAFTGTPTTPTAPAGTNNTQVANTAFVAAAIAALVNSSPAALDTLNELAAALGNDPNFATTMANALGQKAPLSHVGATGTAHGNASTSVAGFMSAADKTKLDGIAAGAQVNAVTSVAGKTGAVALAVGDVSGAAPTASPAFTGTPTAPNPSTGARSAQIATMQKFADEFPASISWDGYQKLPSGLIIQWGNVYISANPTTFSFPIAFPNACFSLVTMGLDAISGTEVMNPSSISASGFVGLATLTSNYRYIAIGY